MLSHVKSGAIYHNYSISPNISSSFFDFSSLSLSFRRIMPQFCCIALCVMAPLPQLCRPARVRLTTIFPLFSRAFAPLPTAFAGSYRKARAYVSYDTSLRFLCYVPSCLTIRAADSHLQSCRKAGEPSEGGWRSGRGHDASSQGGKRLSVMDIGGRASRLCYPVSVPWARLSIVCGAIEIILGVLIYIKNIIIL